MASIIIRSAPRLRNRIAGHTAGAALRWSVDRVLAPAQPILVATVIAVMTAFAMSSPSDAANTDAKTSAVEEQTAQRALIRELMTLTGVIDVPEQIIASFVPEIMRSLREHNPDFPELAVPVVQDEVVSVYREHAESLLVSIERLYARRFTTEELRELVTFYGSPLGRKAVTALPQMLEESFTAGQRWAESLKPVLGRRIESRLQEEFGQ